VETNLDKMERINDKTQLAPIIIGKLLNIGGVLQRQGDRMLLQFGLNQQQFSIFFEIAKVGKMKQKDVVNRLLLEKAHISKVVKKLKKMELITATSLEQDKRSYWLSITPKGEKVLNHCMEIFENWNLAWVDEIDEPQLNLILENLTKLQSVFINKHQNK